MPDMSITIREVLDHLRQAAMHERDMGRLERLNTIFLAADAGPVIWRVRLPPRDRRDVLRLVQVQVQQRAHVPACAQLLPGAP